VQQHQQQLNTPHARTSVQAPCLVSVESRWNPPTSDPVPEHVPVQSGPERWVMLAT